MSIQAFEIAQKAISEMAANAVRVEKELERLARAQADIMSAVANMREMIVIEVSVLRAHVDQLTLDVAKLREHLLP